MSEMTEEEYRICSCKHIYKPSQNRLDEFPESIDNGLCDECYWEQLEKDINDLDTEIVIQKYEIELRNVHFPIPDPNCSKCNVPLQMVDSNEPWHNSYWICPKCDGTTFIGDR